MKSQIEHLVCEAVNEVSEKGLAACDRSVLLAGLWWLKYGSDGRRNRKPLEIALKVSPWAVAGVVFAVIEKLVS